MQEYKFSIDYKNTDGGITTGYPFVGESIEAAANHWNRSFPTMPIVRIQLTGKKEPPRTSDGHFQRFLFYSSDRVVGSTNHRAEVVDYDINKAIERFNSFKGETNAIVKIEHIGPVTVKAPAPEKQPAEQPAEPDVALAVDLLVRLYGARMVPYNREMVPKRILEAYDKHTENT